MSSPQQILANQANAQLSTGPRTAEGKLTASKNSFRHGLAATSIHQFAPEIQEKFQSFRNRLEAEMLPGSDLEQLYFEHFVFSHFMALRAQALEANLMHQSLANLSDEAAYKRWQSAARYVRTHSNAANKALATFREFQLDRYQAALVQAAIVNELKSEATVPVSAPIAKLLDPSEATHSSSRLGMIVVHTEHCRNSAQLQNEANPEAAQ